MYEVECLAPKKVTYSHTGFHNAQASYFNMKVLVFAVPWHMVLKTTANLNIMIKIIVPLGTTPMLPVTCSLAQRYVHH